MGEVKWYEGNACSVSIIGCIVSARIIRRRVPRVRKCRPAHRLPVGEGQLGLSDGQCHRATVSIGQRPKRPG
jgi:hypothetical protein